MKFQIGDVVEVLGGYQGRGQGVVISLHGLPVDTVEVKHFHWNEGHRGTEVFSVYDRWYYQLNQLELVKLELENE